MAIPTLDEALKEARAAQNSSAPSNGGALNLDLALNMAKAAGNDPSYRARFEYFKNMEPPEDLKAPEILKPIYNPETAVRPEDTLTPVELPERGITDSLRQGVANMIKGMSTPQSWNKTREWLATLDDAQYQQAVNEGFANPNLAHLPQEERARQLLAGNEMGGMWDSGVNAVADFVAPGPTKEPEGWWGQTVHKGLEMAPSIAANVAKYYALGPTAWIAQNAMSGNAAAREQVFNEQIAQGKTVPEALAQSNSLGWNAADIATRGATDAATLAAFGAGPNMYGNMSPILQRILNIGKGAGISGLGAAGENVIGSAWRGQDIDPVEAAKTGLGAAAGTGLFGLFNMALSAKKLAGEHRLWKTINDFNKTVKEYGKGAKDILPSQITPDVLDSLVKQTQEDIKVHIADTIKAYQSEKYCYDR